MLEKYVYRVIRTIEMIQIKMVIHGIVKLMLISFVDLVGP